MKAYTALFAIDVPHYGRHDIEAEDDDAAIAAAEALYKADGVLYDDPAWDYAGVARIVHIEDPDGNMIAEDKALDECFIRYGGEADRLLCENAAAMLELLRVIEESGFLHESGGDDSGGHLLADVRALICKATGAKSWHRPPESAYGNGGAAVDNAVMSITFDNEAPYIPQPMRVHGESFPEAHIRQGDTTIATCVINGYTLRHGMAILTLLAQAPAMLAMLQSWVNFCDRHKVKDANGSALPIEFLTRELIDRARGQS